MALTQVDQGLLGTNAQYTGFKNRIINGGMTISQRNGTTATSQVHGAYNLDRFWGYSYNGGAQTGKYTVAQSSTAPTGFVNSLLVTSSASTAVSANDLYSIGQHIEGLNTYDLAWGTSSASTVTLSFWVRCSLTGTFGGIIKNQNNNYNYPFQFTISSANTFEYKTITISGPTSGTWQTDNSTGLTVSFNLQVGTSATLPANGTWQASGGYGATGCVNILNTNGATFYLTGVQLEKGSTATSFDYRPYGTELQLCMRYFQSVATTADVSYGSSGTAPMRLTAVNNGGATPLTGFQYPVAMRVTPTFTVYGGGVAGGNFNTYDSAGGSQGQLTFAGTDIGFKGIRLNINGRANSTYQYWIDCGTGSNQLGWAQSAEL
jgi:hypothetical protein